MNQLIYDVTVEGIKFKISLDTTAVQFTTTVTKLDKLGGHYHIQHELFLTSDKTNIFQFEDSVISIANQCLIIPPFTQHATALNNTFAFAFSMTKSSPTTKNTNKLMTYFAKQVRVLNYSNTTYWYLHQIYEIFNTTHYASKEIECLLYLFLTNLFKDNKLIEFYDTSSNQYAYIPLIESYIFTNYNTDISLEDLAQKLKLSTRQTSRIIKSNFNVSLSTLISNRRLDIASKLLTNTKYSISTIIEMVNLNNESNFYALFKKKYGCTPTRYRQALYKESNNSI